MLSCQKIADTLSKFEGGKTFKIENFNPLFEQSSDFDQKYLQLVEDKIQENDWIDPSLEPEEFTKTKVERTQAQETTNDGEEETYLTYREHQTVDLPPEILKLIQSSRQGETYYYGMKGSDSFLASILLAVEPGYWFQHRKKSREYANELKTTFNIKRHDIVREIPKESIGLQYEDTILGGRFPEDLDSDKSIEFQFVIGQNFGVNILVLDLANKTGHFSTDWDLEKDTVVLMKDLKTYLPILGNKSSKFSPDEVKTFEKRFQIVYPVKMKVPTTTKKDRSPKASPKAKKQSSKKDVVNVEIQEESPKPKKAPSKKQSSKFKFTKSDLKGISEYKVKDLQELATRLGISLMKTKDGKSVKKIKGDLYSDISDFVNA